MKYSFSMKPHGFLQATHKNKEAMLHYDMINIIPDNVVPTTVINVPVSMALV